MPTMRVAFENGSDEAAAEFDFDLDEKRCPMKDNESKTYCTIDHSNKLSDGREFDLYQYWLNQAKRRKEIEVQARQNGDGELVLPKKSRLT